MQLNKYWKNFPPVQVILAQLAGVKMENNGKNSELKEVQKDTVSELVNLGFPQKPLEKPVAYTIIENAQ